jgi:hypothetical protein
MSYMREAFEQVVQDRKAVVRESWYVILWEDTQYYGGPEEGGWYGWDHEPVEYAVYPNEETAHAVAEKVRERADELTRLSRRRHGERCLAELEWLDARGLDADYLPEPDQTSYSVTVGNMMPEAVYGGRHYD